MKYEIRKVADHKYIYNRLRGNSKFPIGVLVFGPDFSSKQLAFDEFCKDFPYLIRFDDNTRTLTEHTRKMNENAVRKYGAIMMMPGECSMYRSERGEYIKWLKYLGAKTIIGIYVRKNTYEENETSKEKILHNNQLMMMLENPPSTDEFDYYIIVS